jgi:hypothetical protein
MVKQTILSMTYFRNVETDNFDHEVFLPCWNW